MSEPRELTVGNHTILIDDADYLTVSQFKWNVKADKKTFYAQATAWIGNNKYNISLHRLLTGFRKVEIDHINRDGLDNRRCNLRYATTKQNQCNRVRLNKHGYRGVFKPKNTPWFSFQIQFDGKRINKNGFATAEDAAKAYDEASRQLHGEFGIRNFKD